MTDYWLSKLFFDLQNRATAAEYRAGRAKVLERYPLKPEMRRAVVEDDVTVLARHVNPYLLRYYFQVVGMADDVFIRRLRESAAPPSASANS